MKEISPFKNIVILGVGLIGGSIGLGLKKYSRGMTITGVGRNITRLRLAKSLGAVDTISLDLAEGVKDRDFVILAQPVAVIKKTLDEIYGFLKHGAVVIDVGGTKKDIINQARKSLPSNVHFIGTHPLAGSEKTGVGAASADLFKGARCVIIRDRDVNQEAFKKVVRLFKILGSEIIYMNADKHDELAALVSHLPHLIAQALAGTVGNARWEALKLASTGLRDTTRIAGSSPQIWRDIFIENKRNVLRCLSAYEKELKRLRCLIDKDKEKELLSYLTKIRDIRNTIESNQ